jgi:hypothetical protein
LFRSELFPESPQKRPTEEKKSAMTKTRNGAASFKTKLVVVKKGKPTKAKNGKKKTCAELRILTSALAQKKAMRGEEALRRKDNICILADKGNPESLRVFCDKLKKKGLLGQHLDGKSVKLSLKLD